MILRIARMGANRRHTALKTPQIVGTRSLALHHTVDRAAALVNVAARGGWVHPWVRLTACREFVRIAVATTRKGEP